MVEQITDGAATPKVEVEEKPFVPLPFKIQYKIRTVHGDYVVRRPTGAAGARHFAIMARIAPNQHDSDGQPMFSPAAEDKLYEMYEVWAQKVLKTIIISGPDIDGQKFTYDLMPPEDQWAIYIAMTNLIDAGDGPLFRFIDT